MNWTIKSKMAGMGVLIVLALGALAGAVQWSNFVVGAATDNNRRILQSTEEKLRRNQEQAGDLTFVSDLLSAQIRIVLSAKNSIIDKDSGKIDKKRMERINENAALILDNIDKLKGLAKTGEDKERVEELTITLRELVESVSVEMVDLIAVNASKKMQLDIAFSKIQRDLERSSNIIDDSLRSIKGALEDRLMNTLDDTTDLEMHISLVTDLMVRHFQVMAAATGALLDRNQGRINARRGDVIEEGLAYMLGSMEQLGVFAQTDEEKDAAKKIQDNLKKISKLINTDLVKLIEEGAMESLHLRASFQQFNDVMQVRTEKAEEGIRWLMASLQAEVKKSSAELEASNKSLIESGAELEKVLGRAGLAAWIVFGFTVAVTILVFFFFARSIIRPLEKGVDFARAIRHGDLSGRLKLPGRNEIAHLGNSLDEMADSLEVKASLAECIAEGDLTREAVLSSDRDVLGKALQTMLSSLNDVLCQVSDAVGQVASGAAQVSDSSQTLSQGATEQAASLEEISSTMTEVGSQTKTNAENAQQAASLTLSARDSAEQGNSQMSEMISAMQEITSSSKEINKIIKTIDDIAFQTNLLALNAAVEAARAGKHGKGFAVVAQEVRNLAARSAKAAQETAVLIESSVKKTDSGAEIVNHTAESLQRIVEEATKAADLVSEIAAASNEQAQGIAQVNQGLEQVEKVTQSNTASAEQTASAAEELSSQAAMLKRLLTRFKLERENGGFLQSMDDEFLDEGPAQAPLGLDSWGGLEAGKKELKDTDREVRPKDLISLDDDFGKY